MFRESYPELAHDAYRTLIQLTKLMQESSFERGISSLSASRNSTGSWRLIPLFQLID